MIKKRTREVSNNEKIVARVPRTRGKVKIKYNKLRQYKRSILRILPFQKKKMRVLAFFKRRERERERLFHSLFPFSHSM